LSVWGTILNGSMQSTTGKSYLDTHYVSNI